MLGTKYEECVKELVTVFVSHTVVFIKASLQIESICVVRIGILSIGLPL